MAKTKIRKELLVYTSWLELKEPILLGTLYSDIVKPLRAKSPIGSG